MYCHAVWQQRMQTMGRKNMIIRPLGDSEHDELVALVREAFWNLYVPGCDEHYLAHIMRTHPDYLPGLEFVAEQDGRLVGAIMYTKSYLEDGEGRKLDTLTFGPLCVHPQYQRRGIGPALIAHTAALARSQGCPAIIIYGDAHNYCKHGFRNGRDFQVADARGRYPLGLLVLPLDLSAFGPEKSYIYHYSDVYEVDHEAAVAFDRTLPEKPKAWRWTQELFSMQTRAYLE